MARNRKSQSAAVRFGPAIKALVICLLLGGSGIGYVWQKDQIARLGVQIKTRERRVDALQEQNKKLRNTLAGLQSPDWVLHRIKELRLGLEPQQPVQVWHLTEPAPDAPTPYPVPNSREYALHSADAAGQGH
jgi:hypothetical protein